MAKRQFWTLRYTLINVFYFMSFCTIHQFAAVYLLQKDFTNTQIGLALALANILSAVCQPIVASLVDKPGKFTNRNVIIGCSSIIILGAIVLLLVNDVKAIVFIVFAMIYMIQFVYQPILTAIAFEHQRAGCELNYGVARGLGSVGFAVFSAFAGTIVENIGVNFLMAATIVLMLALCFMTYFFRLPNKETEEKELSVNNEKNNIFDFVKKYPEYVLFLLAVVCFFFGHNMLNDYLIQIIQNVGGAESQLGIATFIAAVLEFPSMAIMPKLVKKISARKLLVMSGVFFLVKILVVLVATNMTILYFSQMIQLLAYAVFIPASAFYVEEIMSEQDKVKGQAFITSAITLSGVFSGVICGRVLDLFGVHTMLLIGAVVTAAGILIAIKAVLSKKNVKFL